MRDTTTVEDMLREVYALAISEFVMHGSKHGWLTAQCGNDLKIGVDATVELILTERMRKTLDRAADLVPITKAHKAILELTWLELT